MADVQGGRIRIVLTATDQNFTQTLNRAKAASDQAAQSFAKVSTQIKILNQTQGQGEAGMLRMAQAQARQLAVTGNHAGAVDVLQQALGKATGGTVQYTNATTQLIKQQQLAAGANKNLANTVGDLINRFGIIAAFFAARQLGQFVGDLISSANEMEKVQAKTRALSGSQQRYNEVILLAKTNTQKFGGSLKDNIDSLSSFVNLANRTGVDLGKLENAARRLAIVDPVQGFSGAAVALKE